MKSKGSKVNLCFLFAWFLMVGGTICILTSIATSYWRGEGEFHEGIFQRCNGKDCKSVTFFNGKDGELDLVRILMVIGNFYILLALILVILSVGPKTAGTILRILSFVHCIVAMGCYTYFFNNMTFLWSFYLCWAGLGVFLLGLILIITLDMRKSKDKDLPAPEDSEEEEDEEEEGADKEENNKK